MGIGSTCREKQVQVACQGRIMVCCEIHLAAVARPALALAQFLDFLVLLGWREYESPSARLDFSHQNRNGTIFKGTESAGDTRSGRNLRFEFCKSN